MSSSNALRPRYDAAAKKEEAARPAEIAVAEVSEIRGCHCGLVQQCVEICANDQALTGQAQQLGHTRPSLSATRATAKMYHTTDKIEWNDRYGELWLRRWRASGEVSGTAVGQRDIVSQCCETTDAAWP